MKHFIIMLIPVFLLTYASYGDYDVENIMASSVRVEGIKREFIAEQGVWANTTYYGSGTVVSYDKSKKEYYIITNGHVIDGLTSLGIRYMTPSKQLSDKIPLTIKLKKLEEGYTSNDFAVICVKEKDLNGYTPNIIPLGKNGSVSEGDYIYGAGWPNSNWCQFWLSRVEFVDNQRGILGFTMPPVAGQSGSAIIRDINGKPFVVGVVTWIRANKERTHFWGEGVVIDKIRTFQGEATRRIPTNNSGSYIGRTSTTPVNQTNDVCFLGGNGCGQHRDYHFVVIDLRTNEVVKNKDGSIKLFCPNRSITGPRFAPTYPHRSMGGPYEYKRYDKYMAENNPAPPKPLEEEGIPPEFWDTPEKEEPIPPTPDPIPISNPTEPAEAPVIEEEKGSLGGKLLGWGLTLGSLFLGGGIGAIGYRMAAKYLAKKAAAKVGGIVVDKVKERIKKKLEGEDENPNPSEPSTEQ